MSILPIALAVVTAMAASGFFVLGFNWQKENCVWHKSGRKDAVTALVITALYSVLAFAGLGDRHVPESSHVFSRVGESIEAELEAPADISRLLWYAGPTVGRCSVEVSPDGKSWYGQPDIEQTYKYILKWNTLVLTDTASQVRYIRISCISGAPMYITELAALGADGRQLRLREGSELTDEQLLVPESPDYLNGSYFDEVYHVRTAWEHIEGVKPYEITHPPLGKLIISLGIRLFGLVPFGWRFMGALFGCLMLPIMYFFLKSMLGSRVAAAFGCIIFALDFMHFVQTRIATIDTYGVFFSLLMFACMYKYYSLPRHAAVKDGLAPMFLCGLFFGLGAASKWTAVYGGAGLAAIWLLRQIYSVKGRRDKLPYLIKTALWSVFCFVLVPAVIYCLAYIPYARAEGAKVLSADFLKIIWKNQKYMLKYHGQLTSTHPYQSKWWEWMLDLRPILYYLRKLSGTRAAIGAFGNPLLWWSGLLSMICMAVKAARGDRKAAFIFCGWLSFLFPWFFITRCAFIYHYFPCTIFLTAAVCYLLCDIHRRSKKMFYAVSAAYAGMSAALFVFFYPVLTGLESPAARSAAWRWFGGMWPF